jgi:acid stress-induced BolA-like protein IbaG/YrbA
MIKEHDRIQLKDGRRVLVIEVLGDGAHFEVEIETPETWHTATIAREDVAYIIKERLVRVD